MTHTLDVALIVLTVSAFLYVALGFWVLTLTPRRLQTTLLGAFAIFFGMVFLPIDLGLVFDLVEGPTLFQDAIQATFLVLAFIVALGLAWAVPEPLEDRRLLGTGLAFGFAIPLIIEGLTVAIPGTYQGSFPVWIGAPVDLVIGGSLFAAFFLLALRARPAREPSRGEVTQLALLGVALAMFTTFLSGESVSNIAESLAQGQPLIALFEALSAVVYVLVAGVWGWNMVQADDETAPIHRAAMLGILGLLTAGAVYFSAFPTVDASLDIMRGVMRTLGVGLLAYGILRHDLAGLDAKVRLGISKTTVAGVFVAVFFVVSEGAQALFADFAGNEFLGVLAAGALVFIISPLQRLADRFAAKAVPGGAQAGADAEERYRREIEVALADDELTREEERHLARRADELGIATERAFELHEEVQVEIDRDDAHGDAGS